MINKRHRYKQRQRGKTPKKTQYIKNYMIKLEKKNFDIKVYKFNKRISIETVLLYLGL